MKHTGEIPSSAPIDFIKASQSEQRQLNENAERISHTKMLTLNEKEVSFEMLYSIIGKRFHECLSNHAKGPDKEKYSQMSDA